MLEYKQIIVPIALFIFGSIALIVLINLLFNYLNRRLALETIKLALAKNQLVEPDLVKAIISNKSDHKLDFRKGWLLAALTFAVALLSFTVLILGDKTASLAILGIAFLPGLLSITYLIFYYKVRS